MKRAVLVLTVAYLVTLVAGWLWISLKADGYWLITLYLFSPRWVVALPLLLMIPVTIAVRWKTTWIYVLHLSVIIFGLMDYRVNLVRDAVVPSEHDFSVMACNLGGGNPDLEILTSSVRDNAVDVLLLQECSAATSKRLFGQLHWEHQQRYNMAIGSRYPLIDCEIVANHPKSHYYAIAAVQATVQFPKGHSAQLVSVHLPTFRPAFEHLQRLSVSEGQMRMAELGQTYREVANEILKSVTTTDSCVIIGGDFNVPCESLYYRDHWSSFQNAFEISGAGFGYTKHTRFHGVRIDHILGNDAVDVRQAFVGPDFGGDHRPLVARLTIGGIP